MKKKSAGDSKTTLHYQGTGNGRFITEQQAKRRQPETVIREGDPKPGYGNTKE